MNDIKLVSGDCLKQLKTFQENYFDSLVTDPPAGVGLTFAGGWDDPDNQQEDIKTLKASDRKKFILFLSKAFSECFRVMKPGAFGVIWSLPRTSHWTATALEDAGFQIRDCIHHVNSQGFPHGVDVEKTIASYLGYKSEHSEKWRGYYTALKTGHEVWWLVQKPIEDNLVENLLHYKVGALNIDGTRISGSWTTWRKKDGTINHDQKETNTYMWKGERKEHPEGRWPINAVFSHHFDCELLSEPKNVLGACAEETWNCCPECPVRQLEAQAPGASKFFPIFEPNLANSFIYRLKAPNWEKDEGTNNLFWKVTAEGPAPISFEEWTALKQEEKTRGNIHPTVKPLSLMRYFVRLITPPGGRVLDPFAGSGTTALACILENMDFAGIERLEPYILIANARIAHTKIKLSVTKKKSQTNKDLVDVSNASKTSTQPTFSPELLEKAVRRAMKRL